MSQHNSITHNRGSSRPWLWLTLLLGLLLFGWVTALTTGNNPYASDRDANGTSKFHFLRECRELAHDAEKLTVGAMGQELPLKTLIEQGQPLGKNDTFHAALEAPSADIVRGITAVQGGGWLMTTPATISVTRSGTNQVLGQLPYQCSYDKKAGKTTAQIQLPSQ